MSRPPDSDRSRRALWWRLFGLLAVASASWALAVPLMTGPDEADHAIRAAAVARRHYFGVRWEPQNRADYLIIRVMAPESYLTAHQVGLCWTWKGEPRRTLYDESIQEDLQPRSQPCPEMTGDQHQEAVTTNEFRGQPFYYGVVGVPTLAFSAGTGAYLMRLVGALLCSAFLASGLVSLTRLRLPTLAVLGGAAALTPSALYFAGVVNPVGLEIAAGLSAAASLLALVRGDPTPERRLVARTGLAIAVLVTTRGLSPIFGLLVLLAGLAVAPPGRIRELSQHRVVRRWALVALVATIVSAVWVVHITGRFPLPSSPANGLDFALGELSWWGREMVGVFGTTTVTPPVAVPLLWLLALVTVIWLGWRLVPRRHRAVAGVMALVSYGMLVTGETFNIPATGVVWQGRHVLPGLVAAVVVATVGSRVAAATGTAGATDTMGATDTTGTTYTTTAGRQRVMRWLGPSLLGLLVVLQVWCFAYAVRHYTVGHDGPANPLEFLFDPGWSPPLLPPWLYVGLFAASLALLASILWRAATTAMPASAEMEGPADTRPAHAAGDTTSPEPATTP